MELPNTQFLGNLCKYGHEHENTQKSIRTKSSRRCITCDKLTKRKIKGYIGRPLQIEQRSCFRCGKIVDKPKCHLRKGYKNTFCSHYCHMKYYTKIIKRPRISKPELMLQKFLTENYHDLEIIFNDRQILDGLELDIYIPALRIGIELNGIFHYEPIYGQENFEKQQCRDKNKVRLCQEQGIELAVIDITHMKYVSKKKMQELTEIVSNLINSNIGRKNHKYEA